MQKIKVLFVKQKHPQMQMFLIRFIAIFDWLYMSYKVKHSSLVKQLN